jgi:hypothetical protein
MGHILCPQSLAPLSLSLRSGSKETCLLNHVGKLDAPLLGLGVDDMGLFLVKLNIKNLAAEDAEHLDLQQATPPSLQ